MQEISHLHQPIKFKLFTKIGPYGNFKDSTTNNEYHRFVTLPAVPLVALAPNSSNNCHHRISNNL